MNKNKNGVAVSSLYTAATWLWGALPCADFVTPKEAAPIFNFVNLYMVLYRKLNPEKFSLQHQLLHRHTAIDKLLQDSHCTRVLEVACGFSPRGSYISTNSEIEYVEMDLPSVVDAKRAQLEQTSQGRAVLERTNFSLKAADITRLDFSAEFSCHSGIHKPTAVITEGLMMYFPRSQQMPIWQNIATFIRQTGGMYLFDYIPLDDEPPRSFVGHWLHLLRTRILKIKSDFAYDSRGRADVMADLEAAGFSSVQAIDTGVISQSWNLPQSTTPTRTIIYCCRADTGTEKSNNQTECQ